MLQKFLSDGKFFLLLLAFDEDLAEKHRSSGCFLCGASLHKANFQRKPRGGPSGLDAQFGCRFSFCCYACRKRSTPSSLRFLGRRVYLGAVVVLVSAMLGGASPVRRRRLRELCGADDRTLARWRTWWAEVFSQGSIWKDISSRLAFCGTLTAVIPRRLLRALNAPTFPEALSGTLQILLPMTGGGGAG
jgi:hypothetical protein